MSDRKTLALSKDTPVKKSSIPKQRDITCKVRVQFEPSSTLLDYLRVFDSHGNYLVRKVTVNPEQFVDGTIERYLLINNLKKEPSISLNIDQNMVDGTKSEEEFLNYVDEHCKDVLSQELKTVSKLLDDAKRRLVPAVLERFHDLLFDDELVDDINEWITRGLVRKVSKGEWVLNWTEVIGPCLKPLFQYSCEDPELGAMRGVTSSDIFGFIDVADNPTLRAICGLTSKKSFHPFFPLDSTTIYICDRRTNLLRHSLEILVKYAGFFLMDLRSPTLGSAVFGNADQASISKHEEIIARARSIISNLEVAEESERESRKQFKKDIIANHSSIIAANTGTEGERLLLTIQQGIYPGQLYFQTITMLVKEQLTSFLISEFHLNASGSEERLLSYDYEGWQMMLEAKHDESSGALGCGETTLPTLMALKVNEAIRRFFSEHKWFHLIDIKDPKTCIYDENFHDREEYHQVGNETIVIRNLFSGDLVPYDDQLLVDIKYFNELSSTDGGKKCNN
jgi:hypothetical protein